MARYGDLGTQYFDDAGDPLVSGRIYFYETGTTTPKTTYADVDFTIPNTNPVILTAAGRQPNIFFDGVAKAILTTSTGTQILVRDPVGDTANSFGNPWIASKRYTSNDVVQGSDGQYYVSLINGNVNNNPVTTTGSWTFLYSVEWSAGTTYKEGSVITYQGLVYQSLQNANLNKNPLTETAYWTAIQLSWISTVTYAINANVVGTDGVLYTSLQNANTGNIPASSPAYWVGTSAAAAASASAAAASASAASTSATNAATSASTATTQASNASASASSASTSASNASTSASSASTSASNAATSASSALSSANSATSSASSATSSASSASTSASNAATSETNAATSASTASTAATTATTKASEASASASAASTSASNAATSETNAGNSASTASAAASTASSAATNASASASTASTKASEAVSSAAAASSSAAAAANSAASAAAITNISSVQLFTDPLAKAIRVALLASASVRAPQVLDNLNLDMGTNNFSVVVQKRITTTRPAANEILYHKHDGTTGVIVTLLTTGILRLTLNATTFDSTVALTSAANVEPVIIIPVTRETTTTAGSVTFVVDGVQLGTALVISARAELVTNGTFDTDISGWTTATGTTGSATWSSGKMRLERTGSGNVRALQAIAVTAGQTIHIKTTATFISGGAGVASIGFQAGTTSTESSLVFSSTAASASGTISASYYCPTTTTIYIRAGVSTNNCIYDFDTITSLDTYSVDNTSNLYLLGTSTTTTEGDYYDGAIYNRALSVAECLAYCLRGSDVRDVGGTQAAFYTTDFSAGTNSWVAASSATVAGNIDAIGGKDNNLRVTTDGTSSARTVRAISILGVKNGKFTFEAYRPSSNVTCAAIDVRLTVGTSSSGTISLGDYLLPADTWTTISIDLPVSVVTNSATAISLYFADAAGATSNNTSGDVFYVASGGVFTQTGITGHWPAFNAQTNTGQIFDQSGNKNHMLLPASGATILGTVQAMRRQVRWTNTWAATQELQYIGGVNQAILPANAYIESIVGTVSGATPHDIIIGDGSDTDQYVTITTGLATGTTTFTLASRVTDGTNLKLTVDPDTDATMSIAWVITYTILET